MKRGFTLIELSIVLVIIGILIGGILVAQSMINTTKVQSTVKQLSQFDTALSNFVTLYNQLPGDSNLFSPAGNNDQGFSAYEGTAIWPHLSQGVSLKNAHGNDYTYLDPYATPTVDNCPRLSLDYDSANPPCLYVSSNWWVGGTTDTFQYIYTGGIIATSAHPLVRPADALALDLKIDDGVANTGNFWAYGSGILCNSGGVYNTSDTGYDCEFSFQPGSVNGVGPYPVN